MRYDVTRRSLAAVCIALPAALLSGCDGADEGPSPSSSLSRPDSAARIDLNALGPLVDGCGHQLVIGSDPFTLELQTTSGTKISSLASGGLRIGAVPALEPSYNYDPWYFYQKLFPGARSGPKGLQWLSAVKVTSAYQSATGVDLSLELSDGHAANLVISPHCPTAFTFDVEAPTLATAYIGIDFNAPTAERYYGLGENMDSVEQRGRIKAMQFELDPKNEDVYNQEHVPVPMVISTSGWGVLVEDYHPGAVDVAKTQPDRVRLEFGTPQMRFHWMAADRPVDVVKAYTSRTGTPAIPPLWAFAPIQWRNSVTGQDQVLRDAADIRKYHITGSGIWLDRPYETYISSMDMSPAMFPDPDGMVATMHASGFRLAGWNVPYMDPADPAYSLAKGSGWFIKGYETQAKFGPMMDLTNPEAMSFWQGRVRDAIDRGFEGWKMDYGEDIIQGASSIALHSGFYNQEDNNTMHHKYSEFFHRAYQEPYDGQDMFMLSRNGAVGGQKFTSVIWPGDLDNNFAKFDENHLTGGLPAAMIAGLSLSTSGFPFYASDTGGFKGGKPTSEVLLRWVQYSSFLPIMQYGGCGEADKPCHPWDFQDTGETTFNQQTLDVFRTFSQLHTQLFPFFYRLAERARETGEPPVSPYGFYYPADGHHPDDEMVVGDSIVVAPLVTGGTSRQVFLPAGTFVDYWTGAKITGPAQPTVQVPLDRVPIYLAEGSIIPMVRPSMDSIAPVSDPTVDSWATDAGRVYGYVIPGSSRTSFDLPFKGGTLSTQAGTTSSLAYAKGTTPTRFTGLNIRVYAPNATSVSRDGVALKAGSVGETATCSGCFARESGSPWLWIGLGDMNGWSLAIK